MVQTLKANKVTLGELEAQFGLVITHAAQFFTEWMEASGEVTIEDTQALERVKSNFENLLKDPPLLEGAVKMVVLSPLLDKAGFYQPPFRIKTETEIRIANTDEEEGVVISGVIDVLVVSRILWVLVIESKMSDFSLTKALPQALSYMLSSPSPVYFGLITNGSEFVFLKLSREGIPQYATSKVFSLLAPGNELVEVLRVLRHLGQLAVRDLIEESRENHSS